MKNELEDIKAVLDNAIIQLSIVSVKQNVFQTMVLDIYNITFVHPGDEAGYAIYI